MCALRPLWRSRSRSRSRSRPGAGAAARSRAAWWWGPCGGTDCHGAWSRRCLGRRRGPEDLLCRPRLRRRRRHRDNVWCGGPSPGHHLRRIDRPIPDRDRHYRRHRRCHFRTYSGEQTCRVHPRRGCRPRCRRQQDPPSPPRFCWASPRGRLGCRPVRRRRKRECRASRVPVVRPDPAHHPGLDPVLESALDPRLPLGLVLDPDSDPGRSLGAALPVRCTATRGEEERQRRTTHPRARRRMLQAAAEAGARRVAEGRNTRPAGEAGRSIPPAGRGEPPHGPSPVAAAAGVRGEGLRSSNPAVAHTWRGPRQLPRCRGRSAALARRRCAASGCRHCCSA
mmetsp:Transcript_118/g.216  ORF Transcript_118/g.216 Transcript_118/m.216 type:complete len:338 (+) Transcript_118:1953-2966(+)